MIKLKRNRILIKKITPPKGEYILPDSETFKGEITHMGPDANENAIGDIVYYEQYDHAEMKIEGEEYVLVYEKCVICKIEDDE